MKRGKLAIIQLIPDFVRNEKLNIGLVFHSPEDDYINIRFTNKLHRVKSFHDELDIDFFKLYTKIISDEFTPNLFNVLDLKDINLIDKLAYNYVNTFTFNIRDITVSTNPHKQFLDLFNTYVYYDAEKKKRPSAAQRNRIIAETYYSQPGFDLSYSPKIAGGFNENINFDYKINNVYIKIFEFRESNLTQMIDQVKIWNYNSNILDDEFVFIVDDQVKDVQTEKLIKKLRKTNEVFEDYDNFELLEYLKTKNVLNQSDNLNIPSHLKIS